MSTPTVSNYLSPEKVKQNQQPEPNDQLEGHAQSPDIDLMQGNPDLGYPPESSGQDPSESQITYVPEQQPPAATREIIPDPATKPEEAPPTSETRTLEKKPEAIAPKEGEAAMVNPEIGAQGAATTGQQVLSKIAGYQSTQAGVVSSFVDDPNFPQNLLNFMQSGDPTSANLWQAILLLKWYKVLQVILKGD